jgi:predicted ATP-dependent protease
MLLDEVIKAVKNGQFHIWAVNNIDEGIQILTGVEAGVRKDSGGYPEGTINFKVDKCLKDMAHKLKFYASPSRDG